MCGEASAAVLDTRDIAKTRRRRRQCKKCDHRFTTTEMYGIYKNGEVPLLRPSVVNAAGDLEDFDERKLKDSIMLACKNRPISPEDLEVFVSNQLLSLIEPGQQLGVDDLIQSTLDGLVKLDKVAAMRYAIQYTKHNSPTQYLKLLGKLGK